MKEKMVLIILSIAVNINLVPQIGYINSIPKTVIII